MLWFPNLSISTDPIRDLLRKNAHFSWTKDHTACLSLIKKKLGKLLILSPFVPTRPSFIFTDASRSGIGLCLLQSEANSLFFIRCGSSTLTPAQKCYSTYNLELLAIVFALKSHHSFVSSGLQFTILTYCAALNSIQEVDINTIESNRTFRALERILSHNVQVSYIPAHHNKVADFLSRTAVGEPSMPEVSKFITPTPPTATLNLIYDNKVFDLQLDEIAKAGSQDAGYHSLVNSVREGDYYLSDIPSNSPLYEYTPFFEKLSLLDLPSGSLAIFNTSRITITYINLVW